MSIARALLCLIFPPFAVADRGCGTMLVVFVLTMFGWLPGIIAAFYYNLQQPLPKTVTVPVYGTVPQYDEEPASRPEYIRLADGTLMEVIEDGSAEGDEFLRKAMNHNDSTDS